MIASGTLAVPFNDDRPKCETRSARGSACRLSARQRQPPRLQTSRTDYAVRGMFVIVGSILFAVFVVRGPEGQLLVLGALLWEVAEKLFLLRYSKRMPPAVGREALIGLHPLAVKIGRAHV